MQTTMFFLPHKTSQFFQFLNVTLVKQATNLVPFLGIIVPYNVLATTHSHTNWQAVQQMILDCGQLNRNLCPNTKYLQER